MAAATSTDSVEPGLFGGADFKFSGCDETNADNRNFWVI